MQSLNFDRNLLEGHATKEEMLRYDGLDMFLEYRVLNTACARPVEEEIDAAIISCDSQSQCKSLSDSREECGYSVEIILSPDQSTIPPKDSTERI